MTDPADAAREAARAALGAYADVSAHTLDRVAQAIATARRQERERCVGMLRSESAELMQSDHPAWWATAKAYRILADRMETDHDHA